MLLVSLILLIGLILAVSFLCSLTEAVLLSLNPLELRVEQSKGAEGAERWLALKNRIERPIAAILVFNTGANTGLATLAGAIFIQRFGAEWLWLFSAVLTITILFGGEMAPKIIGVHHAARFAGPLLRPLQWMLWIGHPLVSLMENFCERLKSKNPARSISSDHIMDIITLVQAAKAEQAIHNREEIIIIHAATLSARRVRSVMVPTPAIRVFDVRKTLLENVRDAGDKLHRSYPVSPDGSIEGIEGYVRVRELFVHHLTAGDGENWQSKIRPVLRISGRASLTQLLAAFLEDREIAALVCAEDGSNIGWITLDDVTETLMGSRG
ncbi:MAG: CNNM domain-containing protein [Verrucomicrobiota bacterium]